MDAEKKAKLVEKIMATLKRPHAPAPYLIVRLAPAIYGLCLLPAQLSRELLVDVAVRESASRNHEVKMCLVLSETEALYIGRDGTLSDGPRPAGGHLVEVKLSVPLWPQASCSELN